MRVLVVVVLNPRIEIHLQLLQCPIDLLPEHDARELVQDGFVEALADPVGLGMPRLRACEIDVLHGEIPFSDN